MILERFLFFTLGKKQFQWFYTRLYKLSLSGMNASRGGDFKTSGEMYVCRYIRKKLHERIGTNSHTAFSDIRWVVFDVGANKGLYAKEFSKNFPEAEIYSFEPSKRTYSFLLGNINGGLNVNPHNFGFSSSKSKMTLYSDSEGSGLASVYCRDLSYHNIAMKECELVTLDTIDDFCMRENIDCINFLKIDTEGHELAVLQGAERMLWEGGIDFIQFEFGGTCIDSKVFFRDYWLLLHQQYRIYRILQNGLIEIKQYTELEEIFCTANFLAERKS